MTNLNGLTLEDIFERNASKTEDKQFINFLCNYLDKNNDVCSDSFFFLSKHPKENDCFPYMPLKFEEQCFLLHNKIENYATKNNVVSISPDLAKFYDEHYEWYAKYHFFKYKGKFYCIERVSEPNQKPYIALKSIDNIKDDEGYIDYDLMIKEQD